MTRIPAGTSPTSDQSKTWPDPGVDPSSRIVLVMRRLMEGGPDAVGAYVAEVRAAIDG